MGNVQLMLDAQAALQERLPLFKKGARPNAHILVDNIDMAIVELAEAKQELPWKKHKTEYGREMTEEERVAAVRELVDVLHFVWNAFLAAGVNDENELLNLYFAKHKVNHERVDNGY